jgi:hypothetical protein
MASLPAGLLPNYRWQALDADGAILPGAKLYSYETGGSFSTPLFLYSDVDLAVPLANRVVADGDGRFAAMFLQPEGYDLILNDADGTEIWRIQNVEDVGQTFLSTLGLQLASGTFDVASGYTIILGDWFVTGDASDTTDPFIYQLPPLDGWDTPITIKHQSAKVAEVTPDGTDAIEFVAAAYDLPAAASPNLPTITLLPGASSWLIASSHGL